MRLVNYKVMDENMAKERMEERDEDSALSGTVLIWEYANVSHTLKEVNKIDKYSRRFKTEY